MKNGYIKIFRSFRDWYGYGSAPRVTLWVELLLLASHKDKDFLFNGKPIHLDPGQFITGRKKLALATGISESYIEDLLSEFEKQGQLQQLKTSTSRMITIVKWADYQDSNSGKTAERQPSDSGATAERHNQEGKECKEGNKQSVSPFEALWSEYPKKDGRKDAQRHFNASVKTAQDWDNIRQALKNYKNCSNVKRGFIKNGSTWFNNWKDWVTPTPEMMNDQKDGGLIRDL